MSTHKIVRREFRFTSYTHLITLDDIRQWIALEKPDIKVIKADEGKFGATYDILGTFTLDENNELTNLEILSCEIQGTDLSSEIYTQDSPEVESSILVIQDYLYHGLKDKSLSYLLWNVFRTFVCENVESRWETIED